MITILNDAINKSHDAAKINARINIKLFFIMHLLMFTLSTFFEPLISSSYAAEVSNPSKIIKEVQNVPIIGQMPELPSGCEITAAAMVLQWAGVKIDKKDLAEAIPKGAMPVYRNGNTYGSNPNNVFIGNPFSSNSFGVYHKPIALLMSKYLTEPPEDITGLAFDKILEVVDKGRPVIAWATREMVKPKIDVYWYDENNNQVKWIAPEHTYVIVGYSDNDVIVNDPLTGKRQQYPISLFKQRWESMGRQSVTVSHKITGNVVTTYLGNSQKEFTLKPLNSQEIDRQDQDGSAIIEKLGQIFIKQIEGIKVKVGKVINMVEQYFVDD